MSDDKVRMKLIDEIEAAAVRAVHDIDRDAASLDALDIVTESRYWPRIRSALLAGQALADAVRSEGPMREARMQQALRAWEEP